MISHDMNFFPHNKRLQSRSVLLQGMSKQSLVGLPQSWL